MIGTNNSKTKEYEEARSINWSPYTRHFKKCLACDQYPGFLFSEANDEDSQGYGITIKRVSLSSRIPALLAVQEFGACDTAWSRLPLHLGASPG
ncbi:hypothetical protein D3C85_1488350 [compost metagenome]